jgi:hypothetical protein
MDNDNKDIIILPERMPTYIGFEGKVTEIGNTGVNNRSYGCRQLMRVENMGGQIIDFIITKQTYFVRNEKIQVGAKVKGFYNGNAPAILIYPPQFHADVVAKMNEGEIVVLDYFDENLVSSTGGLKLFPDKETEIIMTNGQYFTSEISERFLTVTYTRSTRSIPAQAIPKQLVVMC